MRTAAGVASMTMILSAALAQAQDSAATVTPRRTFAVWTAGARDEPLKTRVGRTYDRDLYLVGLRARWVMARGSKVELAYAADLLPAVISTGMPEYPDPVSPCPPNEPCAFGPEQITRHTVYGAGVVPIGLELRFHAARRLALLMRGSGGLVRFSRPVPDPAEKRLNFMFDVGAAAELRVSPRLGLTGGYRLNHLSNGGNGPVNPGMNSRMLELGLILIR